MVFITHAYFITSSIYFEKHSNVIVQNWQIRSRVRVKFKSKSTVQFKSFQDMQNCFIVVYVCIKRQKMFLIVNVQQTICTYIRTYISWMCHYIYWMHQYVDQGNDWEWLIKNVIVLIKGCSSYKFRV